MEMSYRKAKLTEWTNKKDFKFRFQIQEHIFFYCQRAARKVAEPPHDKRHTALDWTHVCVYISINGLSTMHAHTW